MKRRVLLLAAVAVPIIVLAQVSANVGQVVETTNAETTQAAGTVSYINAAQCLGTVPLKLEWNTQPVTGSFTQAGQYRIFASNTQPGTTGTNAGFCAEQGDTNTSPVTVAGQVDSIQASAAVMDKDVSGATVVKAVNFGCDSANEQKPLWICVHWYDQSATRSGFSSGKFLIQVVPPDAPTGVSAQSGDAALLVSWTAPTNLIPDHYIITATPADNSGPAVSSGEVTATSGVRIGGLVNGTPYTVSVVAFSKGGNPSQPGVAAVAVTPKPMDDYWDWYQRAGGTEPGGCASGSAGVFALAGVAALLALRRRTK